MRAVHPLPVDLTTGDPADQGQRTHALIFSDGAVGLEGRLHVALNDRRVDKVDLRREFFRATPAEVRDLLQQIAGQHLLVYRDVPEALEWRQSVHATMTWLGRFRPLRQTHESALSNRPGVGDIGWSWHEK
ncbi:hypothetical protein DQ384_15010 [Sphaerisporangium album]|uniref:Uncharacterized protein n=1 Tax=Sphaerisporangium album TaxID=509200 RepID=A0A367FL95_9ACTN|nr:GIY-YIG nuclease family protein [Sphaerisporangium album]RCG30602.1 hypothetical protein DQ384_15010 [Sphaerisporangium album]